MIVMQPRPWTDKLRFEHEQRCRSMSIVMRLRQTMAWYLSLPRPARRAHVIKRPDGRLDAFVTVEKER